MICFRLHKLAALPLLCLANLASAANWYVSPTGSDSNPGTSGSPFQTIQKGVTSAGSGDVIYLLPGTYSGTGNNNIAISIPNLTVTSTGGAASTTISGPLSSQHPNPPTTVAFSVSASGFQTSGIQMTNFYSALYVGAQASAIGCIFSNAGITTSAGGNLTLTGSSMLGPQHFAGYALRISASSSCTISGCRFDSLVGCIQNNGAISVSGSIFTSNSSYSVDPGGAIYSNASTSSVSISDCTFSENVSHDGGAAIAATGDQATVVQIARCNFTNNAGYADDGGALHLTQPATISNCTFTNNTAVSNASGGAISYYNPTLSTPLTIRNCTFAYNTGLYGGALEFYTGTVNISNSIFTGNACTAGGAGGAIDDDPNTGDLTIQDSTFSANNSAGSGGAIYHEPTSGTPVCYLINNVFWGDTANSGNELATTASGQLQVQYCNVQGGYSGTGNINSDPKFVSNSDFHLKAGSPCFGAGTPLSGIVADLDGNPRHANPTIGAYETLGGGNSWAPVDASVGADTKDRVLWKGINSLSGYSLLWRVANPGGPTYHAYSTPGYTPIKIASGPNGHDRMLLVNSTNGTVLLYDIASDFSITNYATYGPLSGWTPWLMSVDSNNNVILTWRNTSGQVAVWSIATNGAVSYNSYGPFNDGSGNNLWSVVGTAVTSGGTNILWGGQNAVAGDLLLWRGGGTTYNVYGPFSTWNPALFGVGPNGHERILLNDGAHDFALWDVASNFSVSYSGYGPYSTWTPMSLSVDSNNAAHIMYASSNGTVLLWTVATNGSIVYGLYGPF
ncbi:MAG: hypothetical protein JSS72_09965 [Armatimonadetes bacterium]|nr:hypothetical protein [Armatimonadota bacterium]